jgi:hypothetical protein
MAYAPTKENEAYWRKLTEAASEGLQKKMKYLDVVKDFRRDDSFLGNKAPNHMMYKLETLYSKDGRRGYEFLIEYDIWEPTVGIYYGCKGLVLEGEVDKELVTFDEEWKQIKNEVLYVLNNIFPEKDFTHRFKPTNNANDNTYWPFWISLYEDEDIIEVAARATIIIRNIYKKYLDGGIFKYHEIESKKIKTITAFTSNAYYDLWKSLKTEVNRKAFKQFEAYLEQEKHIARDDTYEYCWVVNMSNVEFAFLWAAFCEHIGLINGEDAVVPWQHIIKIFMNRNGEAFKDNLKKQYSNPTIQQDKEIMRTAKRKRWEEARCIINKIFYQ